MPAPRTVEFPVGWPLLAILGGYPLLWLLGLKLFAWPMVALLLLLWLVSNRASLRGPAGFGLWLLFLGWTMLSALMLGSIDRVAAWGYREAFYLTATIVLVFLMNVTERELPTRRIAAVICCLFSASVILGMIGIYFPDVKMPTLAEWALPQSLTNTQFVADQIGARFGGKAEFIGAVRPAAPYGYTNEWGAAMGVLLPLSIYSTHLLRSPVTRRLMWVVIVFSIVPIVISVNRGLWASVAVALVVVAVRAALARRFALSGTVSTAMLLVGMLLFFTPLHDVIARRIDRPNLGTRQTLIDSAIGLTAQSPLFGYGAPVELVTLADSNAVSVGTHGQLWTLLVSQGIPGLCFYMGFFIAALVPVWRVQGWGLWPWSAVFVSLVQMPFYNALPVPLVLAMVGIFLVWRESAAIGSSPHVPRPLRVPPNSSQQSPEGEYQSVN